MRDITDPGSSDNHMDSLEEDRLYVHNVLESALTLSDFQKDINKQSSPQQILEETQQRIRNLISFQATALYLVDEDNSNFILSAYQPLQSRKVLEEEIDYLIDNGSFGWAIRERRGVLIESADNSKRFLLHVLATASRVRGMFVGVIRIRTQRIPETFRSLLSMILLNTANAIESLELYNLMHEQNLVLEAELHERTYDLKRKIEELGSEIEKRKQVEILLKEKKEQYHDLIETITDWIWEVDVEGTLTYSTQRIQNFLGYTPEELIGKKIFMLMPPEEAARIKRIFGRHVGSKKPHMFFETKVVHKAGHTIAIENNGKLFFGKDDKALGYRGVACDVTERNQARKEKKDLAARLARAEKMEALGTLAGGVAHDLNNVLSAIVSYPSLLLMDLPENSPLKKPLLTIQESGQRAAAIVQDLLTLARRGVAITEIVNMNNIISDYLASPESNKLKTFHPSVKIETDLEENILNILGSTIHLTKTVMNLVSNAAEAMPQGGIISISTENRYIDSSIGGYENIHQGDYVALTVSDTGEGMSPEDIKKIFEPFYSKKKMGRSGTGLGMAVVWGTIKDHNGHINVQSSLNQGTDFTLYFPVTRKGISKSHKDISIHNMMGNGETILVVDDVKEQREIASSILTTLGYSVDTVSGGKEAVEYLAQNPADLLVLDMIMDPGADGLDTYKEIIKRHPGQKAIIASGFAETERVKKAQRLGAGKYLKKPYTLEKIAVAVKSELENQ